MIQKIYYLNKAMKILISTILRKMKNHNNLNKMNNLQNKRINNFKIKVNNYNKNKMI